MPEHKGVKLNIVSQWELKLHPEFPHPESTQFTFRSPKVEKSFYEDHEPSPAIKTNDSKADRLLGRQSSIVSVYIPSASGSRFFVRYNVGEAADQCKWFYFKLYMNGRHVTSWGTNTKKRPSGQVMRALFEPDATWDHQDGNTTYKNPGIEYRPLFFSQENEGRTAGNDGGLIEIKVFRARGRRRKLPKLEPYKDQTNYGIIMPAQGLLEKPQDARYFDWHLKDAKDNPYSTFKFHYRSWDNLQSLHLIPPNHPRILETQIASMARHLMSSGLSKPVVSPEVDQTPGSPHTPIKYLGKVYTSDQVHDSISVAYPPLDQSGSPYSPDQRKPWKAGVNIRRIGSSLKANRDHRGAFIIPSSPSGSDPFYTSAPREKITEEKVPLPMSKFSALAIDGVGSTTSLHEFLGIDYNTRPLPDVPSRASSAASRASGTTSRAPSVTASLLSYIERDQTSPEPIIGTALAVPIDSDVSETSIEYVGEDSERDDYEEDDEFDGNISALSPPPSRSKRQGIISVSPTQTSISLPNVTFRKPKRSPTKLSPITIPPRKESKLQATNGHFHTNPSSPLKTSHDVTDENTGTISLTESEWMRRTPSPVKESLIGKLWSPTPEKREKTKLISPEREAEMMELSLIEEDDGFLEPEDQEPKVWDQDRGMDGGALEFEAMHHSRKQSIGQDTVADDGDGDDDDGDVFVDSFEVHAMNSRQGSIIGDDFNNHTNMREGNWI